MNKITTSYVLAVTGYFGLLCSLFIWIIYGSSASFRSIALLIFIGPLLLPLRGILHKKIRTLAWCNFMAIIYFSAGVAIAANPDNRLYGLLITGFSIVFFIGVVMYVRWQGKLNNANKK